MDARSWASVFQRIPPEKEDLLLIVTNTGVEIIIQKVIRVEPEFVIVKGRISGATEAFRAILMPYAQISNLAVNKQMLEPDILAVFGLGDPVNQRRAAPAELRAPEPPTEPEPAPAPPPAVVPAKAPAPTVVKGKDPSKSVFLQRLRERLSADPSRADKV